MLFKVLPPVQEQSVTTNMNLNYLVINYIKKESFISLSLQALIWKN